MIDEDELPHTVVYFLYYEPRRMLREPAANRAEGWQIARRLRAKGYEIRGVYPERGTRKAN